MRAESTWVLLALVASLGLVGCGSSDDGPGDEVGNDSGSPTGSTGVTTGVTTGVDDSDSGTGGDSGTATGGVGECGPVVVAACDDPETLMQEGPDGTVPSGYESCADGSTHRVSAETCILPEVGTCTSEDDFGGCLTDADCRDQPNGFCNEYDFGFGGCGCSYGCTTDADCGDGEACHCNGAASTCIPADCLGDADCGGLECALETDVGECGGNSYRLQCRTENDGCRGASECQGGANQFCNDCLNVGDDCGWQCAAPEFGCGDC